MNLDFGVSGRSVLVTGAGSGIGRACAICFGEAGAKVMVNDLSRTGAEETCAMIRQGGGAAEFVLGDVSRAEQVQRAVNETVRQFGRLDFAINNAGIVGAMASIDLYDEDQWSQVMAINLTGTFLCVKYEVAQMLRQNGGGGAIVNMASIAGLRANGSGATAYTVSKHGVVGLTKEVALEVAKFGIRVNALCPGTVPTPLLVKSRRFEEDPANFDKAVAAHPLGRLCQAEEVAAAALFLCSTAAASTTGHAFPVDGGRSI